MVTKESNKVYKCKLQHVYIIYEEGIYRTLMAMLPIDVGKVGELSDLL